MRFSFVVPVYNAAAYLSSCVDSLLQQDDNSDFEILLVDDGSTDGESGPLCDRYAARCPEKIRVIHQKNSGPGAARNTGLEAAQGEYLFFVDSDDYIRADALSYLSAQIDKTHGDVYAFGFQYDKDGVLFPGEASNLPVGKILSLRSHPAMLLEAASVCLRIYRRAVFLESGLRFPDKVWFEDLGTSPKYLCHAKSVIVTQEPLYFYRLREGSIMHSGDYLRNVEVLDALEDVRSYYAAQGMLVPCRDYLCYWTVDNVLFAAQRVLMAKPDAVVLPEFLDYVKAHYPDYQKKPLLKQLGRKKRLVLLLLEGRHYMLLYRLFSLLHHLRGA